MNMTKCKYFGAFGKNLKRNFFEKTKDEDKDLPVSISDFKFKIETA